MTTYACLMSAKPEKSASGSIRVHREHLSISVCEMARLRSNFSSMEQFPVGGAEVLPPGYPQCLHLLRGVNLPTHTQSIRLNATEWACWLITADWDARGGIKHSINAEGIKWTFIPLYGPHHGGAAHPDNQKDPLLRHKGTDPGWRESPNSFMWSRGDHEWPANHVFISGCEGSRTSDTQPPASNEAKAYSSTWTPTKVIPIPEEDGNLTNPIHSWYLLETLDTRVPPIATGETEMEYG